MEQLVNRPIKLEIPALGSPRTPDSHGSGEVDRVGATLPTHLDQAFKSLLFPERPADPALGSQPACFHDLNLDQIVESATAAKAGYDLKPYFHTPLADSGAIAYRHAVMRDIEQPAVRACLNQFARTMGEVRSNLAEVAKLDHRYQRAAWFLDGVLLYAQAMDGLLDGLRAADLHADGMIGLRHYADAYSGGRDFQRLRSEAKRLKAALAEVRYTVLLRGSSVYVGPYAGEADYSAEIAAVFAKFKQKQAKDHSANLRLSASMNSVEARILELVAKLFPELFAALGAFEAENAAYPDPTLLQAERESQFYLAWLDYIEPLSKAGLPFCHPDISGQAERGADVFDLALAKKLAAEHRAVICNDFALGEAERIIVVTGPNQGGKTTFARMIGQLHYLARLGLPVPGHSVSLVLCDEIYTHFEREEDIVSLRSKLEDDIMRIRAILGTATSDSLIILNEIFTSTTLADALWLSARVKERLDRLGARCVWVTFLDELASSGSAVVSMVSSVRPGDPASRTFRLERRPADGLAYALALVEKHRLTYRQLKERIA